MLSPMKHIDMAQTLAEPISAMNAAEHVNAILIGTRIPKHMIAQGLGMPEKNLDRLKAKKHHPRPDTVRQFRRVQVLVEEAFKTLNAKGAVEWLQEPNAYLNDVAPIQCLRSDKELEHVLGLLASIKYGFAA